MRTASRWLGSKVLNRACLVALAFAASLSLAFASPAPTHAAPRASLGGTCLHHDVYLNGHGRPTIKCTRSSGGITPNTSWDNCTGSDARLEIDSATTGTWCFYDAGYLGLGDPGGPGDIYYVNDVISLQYLDWADRPVCGSGWVFWYKSPYAAGTGQQFNFSGCKTFDSSNSVFGTIDVKITQVNLNS